MRFYRKTFDSIPSILLIFLIFGALISRMAWAQYPGNSTTNAQIVSTSLQSDLTYPNRGGAVIAAVLTFFMLTGFAMLETGFTRAKNAVNIIVKNLINIAFGSLAYWLIGFGLMFGASYSGWFGTKGFALAGYLFRADGTLEDWTLAFWFLQVMLAAIPTAIIAGAMAERTKLIVYLLYAAVVCALIYPVFGAWAWGSRFHGGGWLEKILGVGFVDFAGSTVVHSLGGWAALAGVLCVGPRLGKYSSRKQPQVIPGHNIPLAALGVFIVWFGWFGFNAGAAVAIEGNLTVIAAATTLSAAGGAAGSLITAWRKFGTPDAGMILDGIMAGLVAVSASCASVSPLSAVVIGAMAGFLVVHCVVFIENLGLDDPIGAISIHAIGGVWGTLAVGLFAEKAFGGNINGFFYGGGLIPLMAQSIGVIACFLWAFPTTYLTFKIIDRVVGLRVSEVEEMDGLDFSEHANSSYSDFTILTR